MTNNEAISEAIAPAAGGQAKRKVLIVDDHPIVRQGLAMLINQTDDLEAGGEASSAREALDAIARSVPDIALVDLTLGATWGISLMGYPLHSGKVRHSCESRSPARYCSYKHRFGFYRNDIIRYT